MQLKIIQGTKIFIGLPSYDGNINNWTHAGLMRLQKVCTAFNIGLEEDLFSGSSLIEVSRNRIVKHFLETDATHLVFIDADVGFWGDDVLKLIAHNKDIVGGVYPRKQINWANIKFALKQNPDISNEELEMLGVDFAFKSYDATSKYNELMQLKYPVALPTGFLCIRRNVLEGMFEKTRSIFHHSDGELREYFHVDVDNKQQIEVNVNNKKKLCPEHVSEDFFFSYKAYEYGYEVWLDPSIPLCHSGPHTFKGSLEKIAALVREESKNG